MTRKEIATNTLLEVASKCDVARAPSLWSKIAEDSVNVAFQVARGTRKSVPVMAREIVEEAYKIGYNFGTGIDFAVYEMLSFWLCHGLLLECEKEKVYKILGY